MAIAAGDIQVFTGIILRAIGGEAYLVLFLLLVVDVDVPSIGDDEEEEALNWIVLRGDESSSDCTLDVDIGDSWIQ